MATMTYKQREYGDNGKVSSTTVFSTNLTAGNIAAQETAATNLVTAIQAVCLGESRGYGIFHEINAGNSNLPLTPVAQRETKWLVSCRETTGGLNAVTFTLPCANPELIATDGESMLAGAERTALEAAVEAFALSNDLGAITVESIKWRTRST
jgi:hypothetical protein